MQPQKDGRTLGAHLKIAAKLDARAAADLAGPPFPQDCPYVWTWFAELSCARAHGPHGQQPIPYAEIEAWARLTGRQPQPWEVEWLRELDAVWLAAPKKHGGDGDGDRRDDHT